MARPGIVTDRTDCGVCHKRIIRARSDRGRPVVLDYWPSQFGTIAAQHLPTGAWLARHLSQGGQPVHGVEKRYAEHKCEEAA